jgi:hypothetical protein
MNVGGEIPNGVGGGGIRCISVFHLVMCMLELYIIYYFVY